MDSTERSALIARYAAGPGLLRSALQRFPAEAVQWRPAPGKWSAHEVVCHCADSETVASTRIRYLVGEEQPTLHGYDEARWAVRFDYHALPLATALRQVEQVRAWTTELVRTFQAEHWARAGTHTESGRYDAEKWLGLYAEHLEVHTRQLERNLAAWNAQG